MPHLQRRLRVSESFEDASGFKLRPIEHESHLDHSGEKIRSYKLLRNDSTSQPVSTINLRVRADIIHNTVNQQTSPDSNGYNIYWHVAEERLARLIESTIAAILDTTVAKLLDDSNLVLAESALAKYVGAASSIYRESATK